MKSENCISQTGRMPTTAAPIARADDPRLRERRVHDAVGAELLEEAVGDLERAAEDADVLAHQQHALVVAHLRAQAVGDRLQVGHLAHERCPLHGAAPSSSRISRRVARMEDALGRGRRVGHRPGERHLASPRRPRP